MPPARAEPLVTDLTRPFWEAAAEGRLVVQRCGECGYWNHPPRDECDACRSGALAFAPVSGRGTVWSYSVMHQKSVAGFDEEAELTPEALSAVALEAASMAR